MNGTEQAKGHFERTRDGVTWEPVKTKDMRDFMAGTFRDTRTAIEQMRKHPGTERQLSFYGTFRYMIDMEQEAHA